MNTTTRAAVRRQLPLKRVAVLPQDAVRLQSTAPGRDDADEVTGYVIPLLLLGGAMLLTGCIACPPEPDPQPRYPKPQA